MIKEQSSKRMEQEGTIEELKKSTEQLVENKGSSNEVRKVKEKAVTKKQKDRNICYAGESDDAISVWGSTVLIPIIAM
jgi:hypothetical protein